MKFDYTHDDYLSVTQFGFTHALTEFYNIEETELVPAEPDLRKFHASNDLNEDARDE